MYGELSLQPASTTACIRSIFHAVEPIIHARSYMLGPWSLPSHGVQGMCNLCFHCCSNRVLHGTTWHATFMRMGCKQSWKCYNPPALCWGMHLKRVRIPKASHYCTSLSYHFLLLADPGCRPTAGVEAEGLVAGVQRDSERAARVQRLHHRPLVALGDHRIPLPRMQASGPTLSRTFEATTRVAAGTLLAWGPPQPPAAHASGIARALERRNSLLTADVMARTRPQVQGPGTGMFQRQTVLP